MERCSKPLLCSTELFACLEAGRSLLLLRAIKLSIIVYYTSSAAMKLLTFVDLCWIVCIYFWFVPPPLPDLSIRVPFFPLGSLPALFYGAFCCAMAAAFSFYFCYAAYLSRRCSSYPFTFERSRSGTSTEAFLLG